MKRNILLAIASLFLGLASAFAQNTLNIHQKSGGVVSYAFSEKPVVTYTADGIHLSTSKVEVDYPLSNLEKFTFGDGDADAVESVKAEGIAGDVRIYSINGVLIKTIKLSEGSASFSTADLPKGTYIIKNGVTTYKITKR